MRDNCYAEVLTFSLVAREDSKDKRHGNLIPRRSAQWFLLVAPLKAAHAFVSTEIRPLDFRLVC